MTLGDLLRKLREVGDQFNTYEIPLVDDNWDDVEYKVDIVQDSQDKKYYVMINEIIHYETD